MIVKWITVVTKKIVAVIRKPVEIWLRQGKEPLAATWTILHPSSPVHTFTLDLHFIHHLYGKWNKPPSSPHIPPRLTWRPLSCTLWTSTFKNDFQVSTSVPFHEERIRKGTENGLQRTPKIKHAIDWNSVAEEKDLYDGCKQIGSWHSPCDESQAKPRPSPTSRWLKS